MAIVSNLIYNELEQARYYLFDFNSTYRLVKQTTFDQMAQGNNNYGSYQGYKQLGAGLCCGLSSLASGLAIGVVGDAAVRANAQKDMVVGMILILIFAEALGLFGFIVAIVVNLGS